MPSTPERRAKERAKNKAARALIAPDPPRADMGPLRWPTEAEMLARLETAHERRWGATAHKRQSDIPIVGRGNGNVRPGKDEY